MVEDGLVQRSGQGGKGSPFLYRVTAASLVSEDHYACKPVERRYNKKPTPAARQATPQLPAAAAPYSGAPSSSISPPARGPEQAAAAAAAHIAEPESGPDVAPMDLPVVRRKPRTARLRTPRQITPPEDGSWFV
ncbi:hypothetical protein COCSUDRAFT_34464 [Coccomyxa subellipsoidea C-169]|uniref:Uncharacterized protein n=1 Tax=Coccomyxa subellipsoidea (strain C-169) TaxID=574566 RepID=I0YJX6_COCSC|nr:hypothetical protein COCSUDRAFT_34464 [Coccomyxa subellipsoidea C-169]EIE18695.1 hypothetical protein COCSUDRAFT_34464 [Coccomyxa subellipsoidea C-169]|eukprot:XP_005643239.1 hypothetical protein COCSUDRAFT_34464 [Coccomyxa subellipsoidea C-169]